MRKVVLYIAMSLDGYLADKHGGVAWLAGDGSDPENPGSYPGFMDTIDTVILGYQTYHQIVTELFPDSWVYSGKKSYVLTHKAPASTDDIIFTDGDIQELISELKSQSGKDIWLCGGASVVNQFLALGLIDVFCISIIPTILGNGIRLFSKHPEETDLQLISTRSYNGITDLVFRRRNRCVTGTGYESN